MSATDNRFYREKPVDNLIYGKIPPQAIDLEQAVIGACMLEKDAFESVMEVITSPDCFYKDSHQKIYAAMCELHAAGAMIDLLTISQQLRKSGTLEDAGGMYGLADLTRAVVSSAHVVSHAQIVMEKYFRRQTIAINSKCIADAYSEDADIFDLMEQIGRDLLSIADGIVGGNEVHVGQSGEEMLRQYYEQKESKREIIGISSGLPDLDAVTLGWQKSDLIILAGRPGQGKTAAAINFALNSGAPCLFFSLESPDVPIVRRMAAAMKGINFNGIRTGKLSDGEEQLLNKAVTEMRSMRMATDSKSRSLTAISKSCRRWKKRLGKKKDGKNEEGLIIIDYLQLMKVAGKGTREQEIASITRDLKELAMQLETPIIALSQLNRDVEKTVTKRPGLANLRESGSIEQDANLVMIIWWKDTGNRVGDEVVFETIFTIPKSRDGKCNDVPLKFNGDIQKWLHISSFENAVPAAGMQIYRDPSQSAKWTDDDF